MPPFSYMELMVTKYRRQTPWHPTGAVSFARTCTAEDAGEKAGEAGNEGKRTKRGEDGLEFVALGADGRTYTVPKRGYYRYGSATRMLRPM